MTIYLGIDPSLTGTGIYTERDSMVIKTTTKDCDLVRFKKITDAIEEIIDLDSEDEVIVGIEGFSMGSRGRGVSKMYGVGWAIRIMLHRKGISFYEIPPTALKKYATGKGNCEKSLVLKSVFKKWGFDTDNDNKADAYVLYRITQDLHEEDNPLLEYEKEVIDKLKKM